METLTFTDWWECTDCCFASNSEHQADIHEYETSHNIGPADLP